MNNAKLDRALNSVGKEVFVKYFAAFQKCAETGDNAACVKKLKDVGYSDQSRRTRCSNAKSIFNAGKECKALKICSEARISTRAQNRALALYQKHCRR